MELTRGVPEMIEVLPPGTSKAVGLEALLKDLGVSPEEVSGAPVGGQCRGERGMGAAASFRTWLSLPAWADD